MNTRILAGLTLTGVVILASCGQDITPTTSVPAAPSFARAPTCSFTNTSKDAKAYFVDQQDPFFTTLAAMSKAGGPVAATPYGWTALARIGVAANNGASQVKGTPTTGNALVNDLLLCMDSFPTNINFESALGPTGLFGVRIGGTPTAVVARNLDANGAPPPATPLTPPLYGAEPYAPGYPSVPPAAPIPAPNWPFSGPVLFYGNQLNQSVIAGQDKAGVLFDLKTVPTVTFGSPIRVGVCDVSDPAARTLHQHTNPNTNQTTTVIVPPAGIPAFCTAPQDLTASRGSLTQMLANLFTPKSLYAFAFGGGGAGLIGGLSQFGPVIFTDSLAFQANIPNAQLSDTLKAFDGNPATSQFTKQIITVKALSKGGKIPLSGVTLTLSVYNNNGSYIEALPPYNTAVTDVNGIASFPDYYIDKPGGYIVTVKAPEFGTTGAVNSNPFNINGH